MLLSTSVANLFFKLNRAFMFFVNERLEVVPNIADPSEFSRQPSESRVRVRNAFLENIDLVDFFVDANPFEFSEGELNVVSSWRHAVHGTFLLTRQLKKHAIFVTDDDPAIAYGVVALSEPFEKLSVWPLPIAVETMLLPLGDKIVYDGILRDFGISFGVSEKRRLNETYKNAKERLGVVTSLPLGAQPAKPSKSKTRRTKAKPKVDPVEEVLEELVAMIDQFCREHLNDEYATLCRELAEKLARKRPSPLLSGSRSVWAAGIVRTIGWINYLDDKSRKPHMKLTAIDKAFGIGESTGQGKSKAIRTMFKIRTLDPEWTLPSQLDDNPFIWMLRVNGFQMDVRHASRELQEIAFNKGLIPYIPADRAGSKLY